MKGNKLFRLWAALTNSEIIELRQAIDSPLYAAAPVIKKLYTILLKEYPNWDNSPTGKEKIFKRLNPALPYNDLKLRRYFSSLTKITTEYLTFKELKNDTW